MRLSVFTVVVFGVLLIVLGTLAASVYMSWLAPTTTDDVSVPARRDPFFRD